MKILKQIGKWMMIFMLFFIALAVALGFFYQDKLQALAIRELESVTGAKITASGADVSFLKNWPQISIALESLEMKVPGTASGQAFAVSGEAVFLIDFLSFFTDHYDVREVNLVRPVFYLEPDSSGKWNFEKLFPSKSGKHQSAEVMFSLKKASIEGGVCRVADPESGVWIDLDSLDLEIWGDFTKNFSLLESEFDFRIKEWKTGGFSWFKEKSASGKFIINAETGDCSSYHFSEGKVRIDQLALDANGTLSFHEGETGVDFEFMTNENSFAGFLALLPAGLVDIGREYEYAGNFMLNGSWKGRFTDATYPVFRTEFQVSEGMMKYAGYPTAAENITLGGSMLVDPNRPSASFIDIGNMFLKLGRGDLRGSIRYANFTAPVFSGNVKGQVDMYALNGFYPLLSDSMDLQGQIFADVGVKGKVSDWNNKPQKLPWQGNIRLKDVDIKSPQMDFPLAKLYGVLEFKGGNLAVKEVTGGYGSSDFRLNGIITGFIPWLFDSTTQLKGNLSLNSRKIDANEMLADQPGPPGIPGGTGTGKTYRFQFPDNIDISILCEAGEFVFDEMHGRIEGGRLRIHAGGIDMKDLALSAFGGSSKISGSVTFIAPDRAAIEMQATWKHLDINPTFLVFRQWADISLVEDHIHGIFDGNVTWSGEMDQGLNLNPRTLVAEGYTDIYDGQIYDYEPLQALAGFVRIEKLRHIRFNDIHSGFSVRDNYFYIPDLRLEAFDYIIEVNGRHGLDNTLDYKLLVDLPPMVAAKSQSTEVLDMVKVNQKAAMNIILPIRVRGTVDDPEFSYDIHHVAKVAAKEAKEEWQELAAGLQTDTEKIFGKQSDDNIDDWIVEAEKPGGGKKTSLPEIHVGPFLKEFGSRFRKGDETKYRQ